MRVLLRSGGVIEAATQVTTQQQDEEEAEEFAPIERLEKLGINRGANLYQHSLCELLHFQPRKVLLCKLASCILRACPASY